MATDQKVETAMEGGGFYNRNSALQAGGVNILLPYWEDAARAVPFGDEPLVIADYGASQGRNSMAAMRLAIETLRQRANANRPVEVIHNDLPSNDYTSLFTFLDRTRTATCPGPWVKLPYAVGRSYFEQILPSDRVHLAWNSWTLQWASKKIDAPDHIFAVFSAQPDVLAALRVQHVADWRRFLQARGAEMRSGARLVSSLTCAGPERIGWEWVGNTMWATVLDMGRDGLLSAEEQRRRCSLTKGA